MDAPPVQYVTTSDGYNIAYCVSGNGRPVVFMPPIISHIHALWSPDSYLYPWLESLTTRYRLVQYDGPGQGMSSRGLPSHYSLDALTNTLGAVIECLPFDRFVLLASNISGHIAIRFAVQNPERVRALILCCCSLSGRRWPVVNATSLASQNWDLFPGIFMAAMRAATPQLRQREIERFRQSVTQQDWSTMTPLWAASSIADIAADLRTPTLILHPRDYENMSSEESMKAAAQIPGARLVLIEGNLEYGSAAEGIRAIESFLAGLPDGLDDSPAEEASFSVLSQREIEVLSLLAAGRSNQQIADEHVISLNTVRRHVSNVFDKTGVANRAQAGAWARDHGLA